MLLLMVGALISAEARATGITISDVGEMTRKIETAQRVFESVWSRIFASSGSSYESPGLVAYTGGIRTPCGRMWSGNAGYCPVTNHGDSPQEARPPRPITVPCDRSLGSRFSGTLTS